LKADWRSFFAAAIEGERTVTVDADARQLNQNYAIAYGCGDR